MLPKDKKCLGRRLQKQVRIIVMLGFIESLFSNMLLTVKLEVAESSDKP